MKNLLEDQVLLQALPGLVVGGEHRFRNRENIILLKVCIKASTRIRSL